MFGKFMKKFQRKAVTVTKIDYAEAAVYGIMWVAHSGGFSDDELQAVSDSIALDDILSKFPSTQIGELVGTAHKKFTLAKPMAITNAKKQLRDIVDGEYTADEKAALMSIIVNVAMADGSIDDDEMEILRQIAGILRVNLSDYLG